MQILGQLRGFTRPSLTHDNHYPIITDDGEQFFTDAIDGEEFTLFFDGLGFGEFGDGLVLLAEGLCILIIRPIVELFISLCLLFISFLLIAHHCSGSSRWCFQNISKLGA